DWSTTKPGSVCESLPIPYVTHAPMLGRPNCPEPVFMKSLAGAWLNRLAAHDFTNETSSTIVAVCGNNSDTHAPLRPCWENFRLVPSSFVPWLLPMKANRFPSMNDCGI